MIIFYLKEERRTKSHNGIIVATVLVPLGISIIFLLPGLVMICLILAFRSSGLLKPLGNRKNLYREENSHVH